MYAYIKGTLSQLFPTHVVVETCGIGYEIQTPNSIVFKNILKRSPNLYFTNCTRRCSTTIWLY